MGRTFSGSSNSHSIQPGWSSRRNRVTWMASRFMHSLRVELREAGFGSGQRGFFFAESETHLVRAVVGIIVETGAGHHRHADFFDKIFGEAHILSIRGEAARGGIGKTRDVGHDVIGAARLEDGEARVLKDLQ